MVRLEIERRDAKKQIDDHGNILLLDVRQPYEFDIVHLPDAKLIPLDELSERYQELDPEEEMFVYCRVGGRSLKATRFLKEKGFAKIKNIRGGIHAWADQVDSSIPKY